MTPYYDEDGVTIYLGDCREILPALSDASFDLILTDPPYGVGVAEWDHEVTWEWADHANRLMTSDASLFCFWSVARIMEFPHLPDLTYERVIVWSKPMTRSSQRAGATWHWEPVFWWKKGKPSLTECVSDVMEVSPPLFRSHPENVNHPTQKPLGIVQHLLNLSGPVVGVLDPFAGSGTTLVAARRHGVPAIGIDREERYCELAAKRLAQGVLDFG